MTMFGCALVLGGTILIHAAEVTTSGPRVSLTLAALGVFVFVLGLFTGTIGVMIEVTS